MRRALSLLLTLLLAMTFFAGSSQPVFARTCEIDRYTTPDGRQVPTYCSISCGGNTIVPASAEFAACSDGVSYCCASTVQQCDPGGTASCLYGRKRYCSLDGGGNPYLSGYDCPGAAVCWLGARDSSCPQTNPPAGTVCGVNSALRDGKPHTTYCSNICGQNPVASGYSCDIGLCCVSEKTVEEDAQGVLPGFNYCQQVPEGEQRAQCLACAGENEGSKAYTALGCIDTSGAGLAGDLIRLLLGVAGAVALLSIIASGFMFTTSQGDTNKVKQAKELATAAVSGLFFIIFSVIILNFIGVQILRIPGLS